ncbi:MAG: protein-disulfide reductase DsbD N-terminal domain-containing protein [Nevskia sp.]|nr:protein-disulfide reductase DsbD N-terminal domain-containing protein [Nevskia sp.]
MTRTPFVCAALLAAALPWAGAAEDFWHRGAQDAVGGRHLLKADQAFQLLGAQRQGDAVIVQWNIAPGYYLYRKRLRFDVVTPADGRLDAPALPRGEKIHDAFQGEAEIYRGHLKVALRWPPGEDAPQRLSVAYQGCAEVGVCYPPQTQLVDVVDLSR